MNVSELDDAISAALMALSAAQLTLRKGASIHDIDVLRKKAFLGGDSRASEGDAMKRAQDAMDDLDARLVRLEAGRDMEAQTTRKTYTITGAQS
jgi:hypothetical protein